MQTGQADQRFVTSADGTKLWVEASGNPANPAVIFVHGFAASAIVWEKQFKDAFLQSRVYTVRYDMRGHGRSGQPLGEEAYISVRMAEDFAAICEAFRINRPYLAGWSFGSLLAADVCAHYGPDAIAGNILLGGVPYMAAHKEVADPWLLDFVPCLLSMDVTIFSKACEDYADSCFAARVPQDFKWTLMGGVVCQNPAVRLQLASRSQDETALLAAGPALPLLVIHGTADRHVQHGRLEDFMRRHFPGRYTFHRLEGAGHACFYEEPEQVSRWIVEFICHTERDEKH